MLISHVYANLHASSLVPAWPPAHRTWAVLILIDYFMDIPPVLLLCRSSTFSGQARVIKQNSL